MQQQQRVRALPDMRGNNSTSALAGAAAAARANQTAGPAGYMFMSLSRGKRLHSVGDDDEIKDLTIGEETESESASADFVVEQTAGSFFNPLLPNQIEEAM
eukprot:2414102-Rhodomonas_salina.1